MPNAALRRAALASVLLVFCAPAARTQNLLQNPDFDSSNFGQPNGWSTTAPSRIEVVTNRGWPDDALAPGALKFSVYQGLDGDISQCVPLTPGQRVLAAFHALHPG